MKKITHLVCPMSAEGLTKGKVYEVNGRGKWSDTVFYIADDHSMDRTVSTLDKDGGIPHLFNWTPYSPTTIETIYDKYICRNYYTAMAFIVAIGAILIYTLCR